MTPPTPEDVERVASAICKEINGGCECEEDGEKPSCSDVLPLSRAALAAMPPVIVPDEQAVEIARLRAELDEARDLARLICPFPEEVDAGDPIERMPDDLLEAATCLGDLCRALEHHTALLRECAEALMIARDQARGDFTTGEWKKIDVALARVREALGEKP